ncbi:MAG: hypothetical protein NVS2B7_28170 [Herpetosiphon sp.]
MVVRLSGIELRTGGGLHPVPDYEASLCSQQQQHLMYLWPIC